MATIRESLSTITEVAEPLPSPSSAAPSGNSTGTLNYLPSLPQKLNSHEIKSDIDSNVLPDVKSKKGDKLSPSGLPKRTSGKPPLRRRATSPLLPTLSAEDTPKSDTPRTTQLPSVTRDKASKRKGLHRRNTRLSMLDLDDSFSTEFDNLSFGVPGRHSPKRKQKSRFTERGEARKFFQKYTRLISILLIWFKSFLEREEELKKYIKAMNELAREVEEETAQWRLKQQGVFFDKNLFKARKELALSNDVVMTLTMPPVYRTEMQIKDAVKSVQRVCHHFAEYPVNMQEKLLEVSWLQPVAPNKIILREGHSPDNFYFIISGKAVVMKAKFDPETQDAEFAAVATLKKGQCFGEIALVFNVTRTASVYSLTEMQLLSIHKNDFFQIFLHRNVNQSVSSFEPAHIKFCRTLDFLQGWPVEKLLEEEEKCIYNFFRAGTVIVQDSNFNNWIYIVKAGTCQVLKRLRAIKTKIPHVTEDPAMQFLSQSTERMKSKLDLGIAKSREASLIQEPQLGIERAQTLYFENMNRKKYEKEQREKEKLENEGNEKDTNAAALSIVQETNETSSEPDETFIPISTPDIAKLSQSAMPRGFRNMLNVNRAIRIMRKKGKGAYTFVSLGILQSRDVFGLETIQFAEDISMSKTSLSLVSRGAEVIMLRKELFIEHANEVVKEYIRKKVRPYPTETILQKNLETEMHWKNYRKKIYKNIIDVNSGIKNLKSLNMLAQ